MIGLLGGAQSAALIRLLYALSTPSPAGTACRAGSSQPLGGAVLGLVGLAAPELLGIGYATLEGGGSRRAPGLGAAPPLHGVQAATHGGELRERVPRGVLRPLPLHSAMLGALCGVGAAAVLPGLGLEPATLATLGRAAVLAGAVRTPFTVALLIPALSGDYAQAPVLLLAALAGTFVSRRLEQDSLYTYAIAHPAKQVDYDHPPRPQRDVRQRCRAMTIGHDSRAPSGHGDDAPLSS